MTTAARSIQLNAETAAMLDYHMELQGPDETRSADEWANLFLQWELEAAMGGRYTKDNPRAEGPACDVCADVGAYAIAGLPEAVICDCPKGQACADIPF